MSVWNKIDSGLSRKYTSYLRGRGPGQGDDKGDLETPAGARAAPPAAEESGDEPREERVQVALQYQGDLADIEAAGFRTLSNPDPGHATGIIALDDLEAVAARPGVVRLDFGRMPRPTLDKSIVDVRADQVWSRTGDTFDAHAGQGVVVGIIDSGIDVAHPFFKGDGDTNRILAVWDQGLVPESGEASPNPNLLSGEAGAGKTYGVEYENAKIADDDTRTRDCSGHGTHVASTAAGDGRDSYKYVGVAPRADIIAVKLLHPETQPKVDGTEVPWPTRFHDAVTYILEKAAPKAVVINCSFGDSMQAHDGFSNDEDWVTHTFNGATGKVLVGSAGNNGGKMHHAELNFPAGGEAVIRFDLRDERTNRQEWDNCRWEDDTSDLSIRLYYRDGATPVDVQLGLPTEDPDTFLPKQAHGAAAGTDTFATGRKWSIVHKNEDQVLRGGRGTIKRKLIEIKISPDAAKQHRTGRYRVKVKSPDAIDMHVWSEKPQGNYGLEIEDFATNPAWMKIEDRHLIGDNGGANMVTVAAYNAESSDDSDPVTGFSSRGPIVTWGPLPGGVTQPSKPDISAPGKAIDAARSQYVKPKDKKKPEVHALQGTSMSAPHVTGAVALMLQKNKNLTVEQVITKLRTAGRRALAGGENTEDYGEGRLDVKGAVDSA